MTIRSILFFIVSTICVSQAQYHGKPGNVIDVDGESLIYYGYQILQGKVVVLINEYNRNYYWQYALHDTLFLDSSTLVISDLDTSIDQITLQEIQFVKRGNDWTAGGLYEEGTILFGNVAVTLDSVSNGLAFLSLQNQGYTKMYTYEDDTVIIDGMNVNYLHLNEESFSFVNCRNIIMKDSLIPIEYYAFYTRYNCQNEYVRLRGHFRNNGLMMYLEFDGKEVTEFLEYSGAAIINKISLSLNEIYKINNDESVKLNWLHYSEHYQEWYAGITLNGYKTSSIKVVRNNINNHVLTVKALGTCDLSGRKLSGTEKNRCFFVNTKKRILFSK